MITITKLKKFQHSLKEAIEIYLDKRDKGYRLPLAWLILLKYKIESQNGKGQLRNLNNNSIHVKID